MLPSLIRKELRALLRDRHALAVLFLMPTAFILIMSLALRDTFRPDLATPLRVQVVDEDASAASRRLLAVIDSGTTRAAPATTNTPVAGTPEDRAPRLMTRSDALAALTRGRVDAVLVIPAGFTKQTKSLSAANTPALQLIADPGAPRALLERERGRWERAVAALKMEQMVRPFVDLAPQLAGLDAAAVQAQQAVALELNQVAAPTSVQQSVPAWLVFSMFFIAIPIATVLLSERHHGTLDRLRTLGVPASAIIAGKFVPYFIVHQTQMLLMLAVGRYLVPLLGGDALSLDVHWGALVTISIATSIGALGLALLIASWSRTIEQATLTAGFVNIISGALGGIMVPVQVMPPQLRPITDLSPMAWGLQGLLDVFARGGGVGAVLPESGLLVALGLSCAVGAVWRLRT
jgi:ABC-2 type transport system permease protein